MDQPGKRRLEDPKKENHLKQRLVEHIFYRVILELEQLPQDRSNIENSLWLQGIVLYAIIPYHTIPYYTIL